MLQDNRSNWRRTYKSLLLLDYLLKNGSERVVTSSREHIYDLRSMENYSFIDENGKDQGANIRHKVSEMIDFIQDDDKLREERKKAKKNKDKYVGMSNEAMGFRSSMGSSSNWQNDWPSSTQPSRGGFRDHSPDFSEGNGRNSPDVNEFRDGDDGSWSEKPASSNPVPPPRPPSSNSNHSGIAASVAKVGTKPGAKKPIDLGAAALFAQEEGRKPVVDAKQDKALVEDLFSAPTKTDTNANGEFGDFSTAFGNNSVSTSHEEFADFSSAFSCGDKTALNEDAQTEVQPPPLKPVSNLDLMSRGSNNSGNFDLLGELTVGNKSPPAAMTAPPPPPLMGSSMEPQFMSLPPLIPQSSAVDQIPSSNKIESDFGAEKRGSNALPDTWGNVGKLDIDLDNLSLGGKTPKKTNIPMNQMKSSSSGGSPISPTGTTTTGDISSTQETYPKSFQGTISDLL